MRAALAIVIAASAFAGVAFFLVHAHAWVTDQLRGLGQGFLIASTAIHILLLIVMAIGAVRFVPAITGARRARHAVGPIAAVWSYAMLWLGAWLILLLIGSPAAQSVATFTAPAVMGLALMMGWLRAEAPPD